MFSLLPATTSVCCCPSRDRQLDQALEGLGLVVDELGQSNVLPISIILSVVTFWLVSRAMNEEVKKQSIQIDVVGDKVSEARDRVMNINEKLKQTLDETRKADKICMVCNKFLSLSDISLSTWQDIACVLLLVGMIIVLVKVGALALIAMCLIAMWC